jgi:hypothetical protein
MEIPLLELEIKTVIAIQNTWRSIKKVIYLKLLLATLGIKIYDSCLIVT